MAHLLSGRHSALLGMMAQRFGGSLRVAALQPSVSITLDHLGCLDSLVACTRYCLQAVPLLRERDLKVIADSWSSNTEEILSASPDLVVASVPYRLESLAAILKCGVPVLTLAPHSLADAIAAQDPDVLVFAWCGAGDRVPLARVIEKRQWQSLRAVREGRVYCVPDEFLNTPAPNLLRGLRALAGAIHPEIFGSAPDVRCLQPDGLAAATSKMT